jgi:anthranilate synthase component 1
MAVAPSAHPAGERLALEPSLERARTLAEQSAGAYNLIPLRHTYIADCETPVSAFLKLRALASGEPAFLLESAEQGQRMGRYSFIGVRPRAVLRWSLSDGGDPYALAGEYVARFRQAPLGELPPFAGGAVGFFGYDLVRTVEPLGDPPPDPLGLPDMALMLSDALVVFDHLKHTITILANADLDGEHDIERAYGAAAATIGQVQGALAGPVPQSEPVDSARRAPSFDSNMAPADFEAMVTRIVEYIFAGDAF